MKKISVIFAVILSFILFATSSVTCSCEPSAINVSGQMGIFEFPGEEIASVEKNLVLAQRAFWGRDIHALPIPPAQLDEECHFVNEAELHCEFWNEVGLMHSSGRFVKIAANKQGKVEHVSVSKLSQWLGYTLNRPDNAFQPTPTARQN